MVVRCLRQPGASRTRGPLCHQRAGPGQPHRRGDRRARRPAWRHPGRQVDQRGRAVAGNREQHQRAAGPVRNLERGAGSDDEQRPARPAGQLL